MKKVFIIIIALSSMIALPAQSHQLRTAITKVLFNKNSGNLEVMHRFYLHDTEHAVQMLFDKKADIRNSADTRELFANYVSNRFAIKPIDGEELKLTPVGHEIERIYFWVYQEVTAPKDLKGLSMIHNALRDIWTNQVNTVNVEGIGDLRTATFEGGIELLSVEFNNSRN
ncbi:MAG: hypothetical protein HN583_03875 [Kordiimonadaceae bacterium]|nr:hypothetical protein [Kordiimonadaceae bacterium]